MTVRAVRDGEAVASFAEIADRAAAEPLKGTELFVARDALPVAPAEEYYLADLVGLAAEDDQGRHRQGDRDPQFRRQRRTRHRA